MCVLIYAARSFLQDPLILGGLFFSQKISRSETAERLSASPGTPHNAPPSRTKLRSPQYALKPNWLITAAYHHTAQQC